MKLSLLIFMTALLLAVNAQEERQIITSIGYVEVMFQDSSEVWAMMWDDFTFEYDENHSEINVVEGGSNKKIRYKAKSIDYIKFRNGEEQIVLKRYKSPRGRDHVLLNAVHENGEYQILESPHFVSPVFKYIAFQGEVFSLLPTLNHDFLEFFSCEAVFKVYGKEIDYELTTAEMITILDLYLENCLTPEEPSKKEKVSK